MNEPHDAADVVGDTYLAAWRRIDEVPDGEPALFWLYATARRATANHRRGERRRAALTERLREDLLTQARDLPDEPESVVAVALRQLSDEDQELLRLDAWERLAPRDIALVLDLPSGKTCRAAWRTAGTAVPGDLVVYTATDSRLWVAPRGLVPPGTTLVPEPSRPDVRLLELADALGDDSRGMSFSDVCHTESDVRSRVRAHLTRLGLSLRIEPTSGDGECAVVFLHPTEPAVTIQRTSGAEIAQNAVGEQDPTGPDHLGFDRAVRALAVDPPATLAQIKSAVAATAARHGVAPDSYEISTVATPVGATPRLYVILGGRLVIHVYLPTR